MDEQAILRRSLGQFATGVTIVTTCDGAGAKVGLTVNSFCSVSLEPPLVLWCLARSANTAGVFEQSSYYGIHVLAENQHQLSRRFAVSQRNKFDGLGLEANAYGIPLLREYLARFVCLKERSIGCGDHVIHVGRILDWSTMAGRPLIFQNGQYGTGLGRCPERNPVSGPRS